MKTGEGAAVKGIKVGYLVVDEYRSTAYIDEDTGVGTDKYSDEPVRLRFDDGRRSDERYP